MSNFERFCAWVKSTETFQANAIQHLADLENGMMAVYKAAERATDAELGAVAKKIKPEALLAKLYAQRAMDLFQRLGGDFQQSQEVILRGLVYQLKSHYPELYNKIKDQMEFQDKPADGS